MVDETYFVLVLVLLLVLESIHFQLRGWARARFAAGSPDSARDDDL